MERRHSAEAAEPPPHSARALSSLPVESAARLRRAAPSTRPARPALRVSGMTDRLQRGPEEPSSGGTVLREPRIGPATARYRFPPDSDRVRYRRLHPIAIWGRPMCGMLWRPDERSKRTPQDAAALRQDAAADSARSPSPGTLAFVLHWGVALGLSCWIGGRARHRARQRRRA